MNSLQLQCWLGGAIPILNPNQALFSGVISSSNDLDLNSVITNMTEIKVILLVQANITETLLQGRFNLSVDFVDSTKVSSSCANSTSIFIITSEKPIQNIVVLNETNVTAQILVFS